MGVDRKFLNRNHTYEINKVGYYRAVPMESYDEETFGLKKDGAKGFLYILPNAKIFISIESFLDGNRLCVLIEKFDFNDKIVDSFKGILDADEVRKLTNPVEDSNHFIFSFGKKR